MIKISVSVLDGRLAAPHAAAARAGAASFAAWHAAAPAAKRRHAATPGFQIRGFAQQA